MNVLSAADRGIPLHCNICPKKPDFSDLSHLLTHVASKGHLSNYFKLKVKADQEPLAKDTLEDYDAWYDGNNLQDLLRERMALKDRKRGGGSTSVPRRQSAASSSSRSTPFSSAPGSRAPRRASRLGNPSLDPQLVRRVNTEQRSRNSTPGFSYPLHMADMHRQFAPQMQQWAESPFDDMPPNLKRESPETSPSEYSLFEQMHDRLASQRDFFGAMTESFTSYRHDELDDNDPMFDALTPKGIQWPGMAMFDSATPEMKRKRNQKKSTNVLKQLQLTSEIIEPDELVFDASGTLRKTRTITGEPDSSDSLIEGESEPELEKNERKRPRRRERPALAERNVNNNRPTRRNARRGLTTQTNRGPYFDSFEEEDEELTYGSHRSGARNGVSIHRDNSGPDITFEQPGLNYLTAPFRPSTLHSRFPSMVNNGYTAMPRLPPRLHTWDPLNQASSLRPNGNSYNGQPASYESFGQFINLGNQGNLFTAGQHAATSFPHYQTNVGPAMNDMFGFVSTEQPDNIADIFGFGQDLGTTAANPLLGLQTTEPQPANPLFLERVKREEDEATISISSDN